MFDNRRGFTLSEAAVLVAILALAACLITPTLAQVRGPNGQKIRSTANLRLHGQVLALYANTHQGELLNPFHDARKSRPRWDVVPEWAQGAYHMRGDAYAYFWGDLIRHYYEDYERSEVFAAPGDQETLDDYEDHGDSPTWLVDGSYWYSPTMFYGQQRFAGATTGHSADTDKLMLGRHEMADMTFPSRKVVLLEKQDFTTPDKLLFSHPESRVGMLLGDSSVSVSDNPPLYDAIAADPTLAPSGGDWADHLLGRWHMDNQGSPEEQLEDQQNLYPAFYMWTREGIKGLDIL